jgi:hypothetical protein
MITGMKNIRAIPRHSTASSLRNPGITGMTRRWANRGTSAKCSTASFWLKEHLDPTADEDAEHLDTIGYAQNILGMLDEKKLRKIIK